MEEKIRVLQEAASKMHNDSLVNELSRLDTLLNSTDAPVMLPLVGEFSSGKTSLINALTDSKALETATKPTTATIFEIHFGAPLNHAQILREKGSLEEVTEITSLKNENLRDATVVTVFDTSQRVSPYTILVDTPGISSPDIRHQQVLMDFLPQADALLLVIDINQQLTKSLANFLKTASLSGIEINAVLTKSDTKAPAEIEAAKKYFLDNCDFSIAHLAAVSAQNDDLDELCELFGNIEKRKTEILKKSVAHRLDVISEQIISNIEALLAAAADFSSLESEIRNQKRNLQNIQRRIERLTDNIGGELEDLNRETNRRFEDQVSTRLSSLINGKIQNYDAEAVSAINSIASIVIGEYRQKVMRMLAEEANRSEHNDTPSLSALSGIDLSSVGLQGLSYNLDLNSMGHQYDKWIKGGVIAIGAAAAVGAVVATGGAAAAAEGALTVGTAVDVVDTVTDVGSVMSNKQLVSRMETAVKYGSQTMDKYAAIENVNNSGYGESGVGKGMIDSLVGFISEKTMSKPQRARAIRMYIDDSLAPEFKNQLTIASATVIDTVKETLSEAVRESVESLTNQMKRMEEEMRNDRMTAESKKAELRELKTKILTF